MDQKIKCEMVNIAEAKWMDVDSAAFVIQKVRKNIIRSGKVDHNDLVKTLLKTVQDFGAGYPLRFGQIIEVPFQGAIIEVRLDNMDTRGSLKTPDAFFRLSPKTTINISNERTEMFKLVSGDTHAEQKPAVIDGTKIELPELISDFTPPDQSVASSKGIPVEFASKGFGGYAKEINTIFNETFLTRGMPPWMRKKYGITKDAKGVILYGPPGTGKTTLAQCIGAELTDKPMITIKGSEVKNKYYGESGARLNALFNVARNDPKNLYVYFFDEADALFPPRYTSDSVTSSTNNDLVATILNIIDGVNSLQNVAYIFATNRIDLLDEALLRNGRIGRHIYLGLPEEKGRLAILQIHTSDMAEMLSKDVDLASIAKLSKNFSGADLYALVAAARNYAIAKNFEVKNNRMVVRADLKSEDQSEQVTQQYFLQALKDIKPAYGVDSSFLNYKPENFVAYDNSLETCRNNFRSNLACLQKSRGMQQLNYLISGDVGTGKTTLAMQLACESQFPHIQVINPAKLLPHDLPKQLSIIDEVFARARQSVEPSVIILNNLEQLLQATPEFTQPNNRLRIKLDEMLKGAANSENKLLVIATTGSQNFVERQGLASYFEEQQQLSPIHLVCKQAQQCTDTVTAIAAKLGVAVEADLKGVSDDLVLDIPMKDLIYHIRKYAAAHDQRLKLNDFLHNLPDCYEVIKMAEEVKASPVSFFRKK